MCTKKVISDTDEIQDDDIKEEIICNMELYPGSAFILDGDDDLLKKQLKKQTEDNLSGTHNNVENFNRRIKFYRKNNCSNKDNAPLVQQFFQEQKLDIVIFNVFNTDKTIVHEKDLFEKIRINVERYTRP